MSRIFTFRKYRFLYLVTLTIIAFVECGTFAGILLILASLDATLKE
jgi:hypothetical protein